LGTNGVTVTLHGTIAVTILGQVEFARFAATYFLTEIPVMLAAVAFFRLLRPRRQSPGRGCGAY
jgi:ACR3 family arsenite efflux pump ArsB